MSCITRIYTRSHQKVHVRGVDVLTSAHIFRVRVELARAQALDRPVLYARISNIEARSSFLLTCFPKARCRTAPHSPQRHLSFRPVCSHI